MSGDIRRVAGYLDKMFSVYKDIRYMAVSDLMAEFTKNQIKLDEDSERKVVRMLLRLLADNNAEVQKETAICLGVFARTAKECSCENVVDALCENMTARTRIVWNSPALSSFIKSMPLGATATKIAARLLPKLHNVLNKLSPESSTMSEVLDIIGEVLSRNGTALTSHHSETERVLLSHVTAGRPAVRKRAIGALAHLAVAASPELFNHIVNEIVVGLSAPRAEARTLVAALSALANASPQRFATFIPAVVPRFLGYASSEDDEQREIAINALETMIVRCPKEAAGFYDKMEQQISTQPMRQYVLLHALKEVIAAEMALPEAECAPFREQLDAVWAVLERHADCAEEGTRCVVAECLGNICHVNPEVLLPRLQTHVSSPSANKRVTVVMSVKLMISSKPKPIDDVLDTMMSSFLSAARDENLDVRRVALVVLNSAAHNKPQLIRDRLSEVMPVVYHETNVRQELIREVEMGPFKHSVDDGLDLRKSAFECMYTLLDACIDRLDLHVFIAALESGLKDQHDIKLLSYLILAKLAALAPNELTLKLDKVADHLKAQLNVKNKQNAVKQELDKNEELKRAVLRTLIVLNKLPEGSRVVQLTELRALVAGNADLKAGYEALEKDAKRGGFAAEE